ncbi:MAG: ABC transporter ATP-binding protein [Clostridiales Family XIII bacterium]|nr:ABC transporter ATP-binding protein [Clostridiales Family XIII bacterium]
MSVAKGHTHALLGENGSGKTTLMNILFGLVKRDAGEIFIGGEVAEIDSPLDAIRRGVGMIHQEFMLIPELTVAENILVGVLEKEKNIDIKAERKREEELAAEFGLADKLNVAVCRLSVGEQQKVEIIKTFRQGAKIIVLDEPTSMLTPQESDYLFELLNNLTIAGATIILITHKLEEVLRYSDDVTVLRQGKAIASLESKNTDKYELAEKMTGREILFELKEKNTKPRAKRVSINRLSLTTRSGRHILKDVTLDIREGEILGIAGVDGNGQNELAEILAGVRKATGGSYEIDGVPADGGARKLSESGVSYIPGERIDVGCASSLAIASNLILKNYDMAPHSKHGILNEGAIKKTSDKLVSEYQVKTPSTGIPVSSLSGGNYQKIILARELSSNPRFLISVQPTRGLDIGAVEYVQNRLLEARESGVSILLISTELDEILALSDRIAVLGSGQIVGILENSPNINIAEIGLMMTGGVQHLERIEAGGTSI